MKAEPNLDLIKVLIEAKNQKNVFDALNKKVDKEIVVGSTPWESRCSHSLETIWIFLN